jgi:phospholipase/lecithinase/hemolysin/uncharacterized protein YhjY with autotransporter beta-barrel domain
LLITGEARGQTVFTTIQAFGDSYADTGNLFKILGTPNPPVYPTGRFSGGTNFVDTTSTLLGIPQSNFAIGGATTGTANTFALGVGGFAQEWAGILNSGWKIAPSDLIEINIGGNDARAYYQGGGTLAGVPAAATASAVQASAGLNALVAAGARTIVFTTGDVSQLPEAFGNPSAKVGSAYSQNYNAQMQVPLAAIAASGVRVELLDISLLGDLVKANPALYGLSKAGPCPLTCIGNAGLQNQYLFYLDGVHLTSHGFAILGEYIVNRLNAPLTFAPQGDLAMNSAMGFAATLYGKLDLFRETDDLRSRAQNTHTLTNLNPWSFYMQGNGSSGDHQSTVASNGYGLESIGGTIGAEYRINQQAFIGGAFDYSDPVAHQFNNAGTVDAKSYQFGIYSAWADAHFFAQALATYGWQNYFNTRPGAVDTIISNPAGATFVAGSKLGYLFDVGKSGLGPIGSLTYARAIISGYSEVGDPVLTMKVGQQTAEALVGSIGVQLRTSFLFEGMTISPYLNLTVDDDLIGNGRIIQFNATSAPLIINDWMIPQSNMQHFYGVVAAGVMAPIKDNIAFTMNASQTLGRQEGNVFYAAGGLKVLF